MKIIDCFTFYNELEMLEMRFKELYDYVDYFILVEATKTFTNKDKELYYEKNKKRYDKYADKIIHVVITDMPDNNNAWNLEFYQRRSINIGVSKLLLNDEDIIIISDVDEIIDTNVLINIKNGSLNIENNKLYALEQNLYYYNFNTKYNHKWYHSKLLNFHSYITSHHRDSQNIRMYGSYNIIKNGGWHLSYFGDVEFIKNKLKNFAHQEYNNDTYVNDDNILNNITNCKDLFNRENCIFNYIKIEDNGYLPKNYKFLLNE